MRRTAELVGGAVHARRAAAPALAPWVAAGEDIPTDFLDVAHPTGTTRMATEARSGVVDEECRVFGVEGLYIAGSSVFPTGGPLQSDPTDRRARHSSGGSFEKAIVNVALWPRPPREQSNSVKAARCW